MISPSRDFWIVVYCGRENTKEHQEHLLSVFILKFLIPLRRGIKEIKEM
jgi:hypothetical protein